jgi:hypothetical protein
MHLRLVSTDLQMPAQAGFVAWGQKARITAPTNARRG